MTLLSSANFWPEERVKKQKERERLVMVGNRQRRRKGCREVG